MRRSILLSCLVLGCSGLLFRSGQDYYPLVRGSLWKYSDGLDTVYVEVAGDSLVGGRNAILVNTDFAPGFWLKDTPEADVRRWVRHTYQRGGTEYVLEERYALVYLLPLVTGNAWYDEYADTVVVLGVDTLRYRRRLEVHVADVEAVTVPAGGFDDCYRIEFTETVETAIADSLATVTTNHTEWLAPGVGLVRRRTGDTELELAEYRIGF